MFNFTFAVYMIYSNKYAPNSRFAVPSCGLTVLLFVYNSIKSIQMMEI